VTPPPPLDDAPEELDDAPDDEPLDEAPLLEPPPSSLLVLPLVVPPPHAAASATAETKETKSALRVLFMGFLARVVPRANQKWSRTAFSAALCKCE
jgi:hypothetical protein